MSVATAITQGVTVEPVAVAKLLGVIGLSVVHLGAGVLGAIDATAHRRLVSVAGGVSVSYVFVHVLPAIAEARATIERQATWLVIVENHVYLLSLAGFLVFYGLERYVVLDDSAEDDHSTGDAFRVHVGAFASYNVLFGYLLVHRETPGVSSLGLFATTTALHLLLVDYGLRREHREIYHRWGRWFLAGAVIVGGLFGVLSDLPEVILEGIFAFLAGGIVLNAIKEELPADRAGRFWPFAAGSVAYAVLLVVV